MIYGMKLRLDKSGRIVLPKPLRQRMGIREGAVFDVTESAGDLVLHPVSSHPSVVERDGFLVHTGRPMNSFDWQRFTEDLDLERVRGIFGK